MMRFFMLYCLVAMLTVHLPMVCCSSWVWGMLVPGNQGGRRFGIFCTATQAVGRGTNRVYDKE